MACHQKQNSKVNKLVPNFSDLEEKGRLHFFYHSPSSKLPIRDVLNEQNHGYKTEPYIERGAENYCMDCNQLSIRGFLKGCEKYLFLFTTCRGGQSRHVGKIYVVGYIKKKSWELRRKGLYAVMGPLKVFSFSDAYYLGKSTSNNNPRQLPKSLSERETQHILDHFEGKKDILNRCRTAVERLKQLLPVAVRRDQVMQCR